MTKMGRTPPQHAVARPGKATGKSVAATGTSTATQGRVQATHVQQEANFTADDELLFLLEEVTRGVRRAFERRIGAFGLSRAQWRLLGYVIRDEGLTQTDLAALLELERATVGQTIDRLEAQGLVERRPSPKDRRIWRVFVRPAAIKLIPALRIEADRVHHVMWDGATADARGRFDEELARIAARLREDEAAAQVASTASGRDDMHAPKARNKRQPTNRSRGANLK